MVLKACHPPRTLADGAAAGTPLYLVLAPFLFPYLLSRGNVPGSGHTEPPAPGGLDGGDLDLGPGGESPN